MNILNLHELGVQVAAYMKLEKLEADIKQANKIKNGTTPRYDLTEMTGDYAPINSLKNVVGMVYMYLSGTKGIIKATEERRADNFLSTSDSLNVSSLFFAGDLPTGEHVYFGNPPKSLTYSKKKKPNPFLKVSNDGFLFLISKDWQQIEVLVLSWEKPRIFTLSRCYVNGIHRDLFNNAFKSMRERARVFFEYRAKLECAI